VSTLANIAKLVAVLVAAILIGNWFLAEVKKARLKGKPWYQFYFCHGKLRESQGKKRKRKVGLGWKPEWQ